jgi:hypothetical protein
MPSRGISKTPNPNQTQNRKTASANFLGHSGFRHSFGLLVSDFPSGLSLDSTELIKVRVEDWFRHRYFFS